MRSRKNAPRIGFLCTQNFDAQSIRAWSGAPYFMARALAEAGATIELVPIASSFNTWSERLPFHLWKALGKRYLTDRAPSYMARLEKELAQKVNDLPVDALFAPSSLPIAVSPKGMPTFFWTDAVFSGMVDFYDNFSGLAGRSLNHGMNAEAQALDRATAAFYCSDWAAEDARKLSPQNAHKIQVVPFGANLEHPPARARALEWASHRRIDGVIKLLFIGVDWERKGGDFCVRVAEELIARGLRIELHIVGCTAPAELRSTRPWIISHGFISKETKEGQKRVGDLMAESHWFILPSRAECFGLVYVESAAHGLPSLATKVGGIPSAVSDGESGFLFDVDASPEVWAEQIMRTSAAEYRRLSLGARIWYDTRVNWRTAGERVVSSVTDLLHR